MRSYRSFLVVASLLVAPSLARALEHTADGVQDEAPTRYLQLVNRAHDRAISLAVADAGSGAYREVPLGEPLRGGGGSMTVEIENGSCLSDLRFGFANGRTVVYSSVNICRAAVVRIQPLPRKNAADTSVALSDQQ